MSLTSISDTDLLVLENLSGKDLVKMCTINTHFHDLCSNAFWDRRIRKDFPQVIDSQKSLKTIKETIGLENSKLYQALYKRYECVACGSIKTSHIENEKEVKVSCKNCDYNYSRFKCPGCKSINTIVSQKQSRRGDIATQTIISCKDCKHKYQY